MPTLRAVSVSRTALPSSAIAPTPSSGLPGAPSLRTARMSSGACSARATSTATGTPPRGSAITIGASCANGNSSAASMRPASWRSKYAMRGLSSPVALWASASDHIPRQGFSAATSPRTKRMCAAAGVPLRSRDAGGAQQSLAGMSFGTATRHRQRIFRSRRTRASSSCKAPVARWARSLPPRPRRRYAPRAGFSPAVALPLRCGARWSGFHDPVGFDGTPGAEDALGFRARVAGLLDAHRRARRASVSPCPDDMGELRVVSAHDGGGRSTHSPRLGGTRFIRTAGSFEAEMAGRGPAPVPEAPIERDLPHPRSLTSDRSVVEVFIQPVA